ncbi:MAG TPA: MaoC/PaaZ C-terminal domain-containing protein [Marmoricola sp.]|jgi:acyl dehydratase|nr:MaoC/PaaZ C-terminal domain-containing protein [Marmoricola sp.]
MSRAVGDELAAFERTVTLIDMVAYAGATWDFYGLHYDPAFVARAKVPAPVVDGQVFGAYFVELVQDDLGPDCFVRELAMTYKNLMFAGETLRVTGTVTAVEADRLSVAMVATIQDSGYGEERVAALGTATVLLGQPDGPGGARGVR